MRGGVGFGVFSVGDDAPRVGFRVGEGILDLVAAGLGSVFESSSLNAFLALGRSSWEDTVARVDELVTVGTELVPLESATAHLPFEVADYVDFYSSLEHATNLGRLFRPDAEPLLPNWRHLPVGYHGRAGTVVVSGTQVVRPCGQVKSPQDAEPRFGPSTRLDIELELGFVVGVGSRLGEPVAASAFRDHVFGVLLVNDWSARDIQAWEYQPLGPFLGKSFATSIAAWVTPLVLLEDRFVASPPQDPEPLPYLSTAGDWAVDLDLEVELSGTVIARGNARSLYWTMSQQLAHATVNGSSIRTGDLFASGTISGVQPGSQGSLIELTWNGERPVQLADGSERTFLEDGDEVVLRGRAGDVELGEVRGAIVPARYEGNEPAR
ncbi:MAG: fumarylacetoacetase [Gaiellaceae bacterium]|nr:fumarylacetoacetase [Gaiellaceae bacterium]